MVIALIAFAPTSLHGLINPLTREFSTDTLNVLDEALATEKRVNANASMVTKEKAVQEPPARMIAVVTEPVSSSTI